MKDQLITFETAKSAKEKGFDWKVTNYFSPNGISGICELNSGFFDLECRQPIQSLLQKWLREEKKLRVYVTNSAAGEFKYEINIVNPVQEDRIGKPWERKYNFTSYKTYEEALEVGLQEALKLI